MTSKKVKKSYKQLSQNSKDTFVNHYDKMVKAGKNISQIKKMNLRAYNKFFYGVRKDGSVISKISTNVSLKGQKSRLNQIANHINEVNNDYFKKENIKSKTLKEAFLKESYRVFNTKEEKQVENVDTIDDTELTDLSSEEKEGKYGLLKLTNLANNEDYFIKYKNRKDLEKQIAGLKKKYKISTFHTKYLATKMYKTHITKEFVKELAKE
ncbi:unnamed protein product, partial [marine sediment metagenome]